MGPLLLLRPFCGYLRLFEPLEEGTDIPTYGWTYIRMYVRMDIQKLPTVSSRTSPPSGPLAKKECAAGKLFCLGRSLIPGIKVVE